MLRRAVADLEARVIAQRDTLEAREVSLRRALQLASAHDPHKEEFFNPSHNSDHFFRRKSVFSFFLENSYR